MFFLLHIQITPKVKLWTWKLASKAFFSHELKKENELADKRKLPKRKPMALILV